MPMTIFALVFLSVAGTQAIPATFTRPNSASRPPLWISARAALDEHQTLRAGALEPYQQKIIQRQIARRASQAASNDCSVRFGAPLDYLPPDDPATWAAVRQAAPTHTVVDGTVTATDVGFFAGIPATVVEVQPEGRSPVFLLLMTGSVTVEGANVCTVAADIASTPAVGDRVVALLGKPLDKEASLYHTSGGRLFVEHDGHLQLPPHVARDAAKDARTLDDVRRVLTDPASAHGNRSTTSTSQRAIELSLTP